MSDYIHIGKLVAPHGVAGTVILEHALGKSITFKGVDILFIEKQAGSRAVALDDTIERYQYNLHLHSPRYRDEVRFCMYKNQQEMETKDCTI